MAKSKRKTAGKMIQCVYGQYGGGKKRARIGFKIASELLTEDQALELFNGTEADVRLHLNSGAVADADGQETMDGVERDDILIQACRIAGFKTTPDYYSTAISFHGGEVNMDDLKWFSGRPGSIQISVTGAIGSKEDE